MKKLLVSTITAILLFCLTFMAGCNSIAGTYVFESFSYEFGNKSITVEAGDEFFGYTIPEDYMTLEIKNDGTCVFTFDEESYETTWEKVSDGVKIAAEYGELTFKFEEEKLTIEMDGAKFTLKKISKGGFNLPFELSF